MDPCEANEKEVIKGGTGEGTLQYCHYQGEGHKITISFLTIPIRENYSKGAFHWINPSPVECIINIFYFANTYPPCMFQQLGPGLQSTKCYYVERMHSAT